MPELLARRIVLLDGAMGPTPRTASISPDVNDPGAPNVDFEALRAAYQEQVEGLVEGGADVLLSCTMGAALMRPCLQELATVAGCCGTTPEHISAIRNKVSGVAPCVVGCW